MFEAHLLVCTIKSEVYLYRKPESVFLPTDDTNTLKGTKNNTVFRVPGIEKC